MLLPIHVIRWSLVSPMHDKGGLLPIRAYESGQAPQRMFAEHCMPESFHENASVYP